MKDSLRLLMVKVDHRKVGLPCYNIQEFAELSIEISFPFCVGPLGIVAPRREMCLDEFKCFECSRAHRDTRGESAVGAWAAHRLIPLLPEFGERVVCVPNCRGTDPIAEPIGLDNEDDILMVVTDNPDGAQGGERIFEDEIR